MRTLSKPRLNSLAVTLIDLVRGPLIAPDVSIPAILQLPANTMNELNLGECVAATPPSLGRPVAVVCWLAGAAVTEWPPATS